MAKESRIKKQEPGEAKAVPIAIGMTLRNPNGEALLNTLKNKRSVKN
jgi:hypothetical protein